MRNPRLITVGLLTLTALLCSACGTRGTLVMPPGPPPQAPLDRWLQPKPVDGAPAPTPAPVVPVPLPSSPSLSIES